MSDLTIAGGDWNTRYSSERASEALNLAHELLV